MRAVEFDEQNADLGKPEGMTDEECGSLPVHRDGVTCISCWELNKEDLEMIQETGRIYLGVVFGNSQPPVFLSVEKPVELIKEG